MSFTKLCLMAPEMVQTPLFARGEKAGKALDHMNLSQKYNTPCYQNEIFRKQVPATNPLNVLLTFPGVPIYLSLLTFE